jgi:hypothetical protein
VEGQPVNRPLRRWHFRLVAGLAPVALAVLAIAVLVRRSPPLNPTPAPLQTAMGDAREISRTLIRGRGLALELRHLMDSTGSSQLAVYPMGEPQVADLLLYLGPGGPDSLPGDARLLGTVTGAPGQRFTLPEGAERLQLYWYSGATRTVVAQTALFGPERTGQ